MEVLNLLLPLSCLTLVFAAPAEIDNDFLIAVTNFQSKAVATPDISSDFPWTHNNRKYIYNIQVLDAAEVSVHGVSDWNIEKLGIVVRTMLRIKLDPLNVDEDYWQTDEISETDETDEISETDETDEISETDETDEISETDKTQVSEVGVIWMLNVENIKFVPGKLRPLIVTDYQNMTVHLVSPESGTIISKAQAKVNAALPEIESTFQNSINNNKKKIIKYINSILKANK